MEGVGRDYSRAGWYQYRFEHSGEVVPVYVLYTFGGPQASCRCQLLNTTLLEWSECLMGFERLEPYEPARPAGEG